MHELGVVFHIIEKVEQFANQYNVSKVAQVTLEIGEVSTIVQDQFEDCWKWAIKRSSVLEGSALIIETIKAVTFCETCKQTYPTVEYAKICPHCGSDHTFLVTGNEVKIKNIGVYDSVLEQSKKQGESLSEQKTNQEDENPS